LDEKLESNLANINEITQEWKTTEEIISHKAQIRLGTCSKTSRRVV
jgi:hypothetical protein